MIGRISFSEFSDLIESEKFVYWSYSEIPQLSGERKRGFTTLGQNIDGIDVVFFIYIGNKEFRVRSQLDIFKLTALGKGSEFYSSVYDVYEAMRVSLKNEGLFPYKKKPEPALPEWLVKP